MSTKSSKFYDGDGVHLYHELIFNELCLELPKIDDLPSDHKNYGKGYGSFTMSLDEWEKFAKSILKAVDDIRDEWSD